MAHENTIPKVVQQEANEAEADLKAAIAGQAGTETAKPEGETPAEAPAAPTETAAPAAAAPATPTPPPAATPKESVNAEVEHWKQRYIAIEGKFKAEVPRLYAENRSLKAEIATLKANPPAAPATAPQAADTEADATVLREMLGEDGFKALNRIMSKREQPKPADAVPPPPQANPFIEDLTALVPDWETVNSDPDWLKWLGETDPTTREVRQSLLTELEQAGNAKGVARMMQAFRSAPPPAPAKPKPATRPTLAEQVAPPTAAVPAPTQGPKGRTYTLAEYEEIMDGITRGAYSRTRATDLLKEMQAAEREGRIRAA